MRKSLDEIRRTQNQHTRREAALAALRLFAAAEMGREVETYGDPKKIAKAPWRAVSGYFPGDAIIEIRDAKKRAAVLARARAFFGPTVRVESYRSRRALNVNRFDRRDAIVGGVVASVGY
jgi:hypothetical protein